MWSAQTPPSPTRSSAGSGAQLANIGFVWLPTAERHPSSDANRLNPAKSRIRARIEHVFGAQQSSVGGRIVRTIGIMRARAKIGLQNFVYNIRRLATLERLAAA